MRVDPTQYEDPRDVPKYTLRDVAWYLDLPISTLRWWCLGRNYMLRGERRSSASLIRPALYDPRNPSLSFFNLAELHILAATRRFSKISMQRLRDAIDYLGETYPSQHPLLGHDFFTDGRNLFVKRILETVNLSKRGQLAFKEIVDVYLDRIVKDSLGWPEKIYPIRHKDASRQPVIIVPNVAGGQPITPKKGVRISVLLNRHEAGESYQDIAEDYGLTRTDVEDAIKYMEAA